MAITTAQEDDAEQLALAELNPLRYRGYYYDSETGLYYLQSRYYNPELGRFISSDSFDYIDADGKFTINAYAYCNNNPLLYSDSCGYYPTLQEVPPASSGYVPPKGGPKKGVVPKGKLKGKYGWVDSKGNFWVPDKSDHGGEHWDVTDKNGKGHKNVYRDGHVRDDNASKISFDDILDSILTALVPSENVANVIVSLILIVIVLTCAITLLPFIWPIISIAFA